MARHYSQRSQREKLIALGIFLGILFIIGFIKALATNPSSVAPLIYLAIFIFTLRWIVKFSEKKRISKLFQLIEEKKLKDYIENFINRFSFEGKNIKGWEFRNRKIDWNRIDDLEKYLIEEGIPLKPKKKARDIFTVLRAYIQEKEEQLTRGSISKEPKKFSSLSGTDFEILLSRLFEAMSYRVEHTGKSGDQGGDLIANKNGERILIQAKCYRDWSVGNEAVQQVVGAMKFYDCNKSMVITTSTVFTPEAHALANANRTDLISKDELSEMLLKYLGESWG